MNPQKNPKVQIGQPLDELPEPAKARHEPARHWVKVGAACLQHEGKWLPVRIGHLTVDRHRQVASEIRSGKLAAFRNWPGFDARFRDGTLYVRYVDPESVEDINTPRLREVG